MAEPADRDRAAKRDNALITEKRNVALHPLLSLVRVADAIYVCWLVAAQAEIMIPSQIRCAAGSDP